MIINKHYNYDGDDYFYRKGKKYIDATKYINEIQVKINTDPEIKNDVTVISTPKYENSLFETHGYGLYASNYACDKPPFNDYGNEGGEFYLNGGEVIWTNL